MKKTSIISSISVVLLVASGIIGAYFGLYSNQKNTQLDLKSGTNSNEQQFLQKNTNEELKLKALSTSQRPLINDIKVVSSNNHVYYKYKNWILGDYNDSNKQSTKRYVDRVIDQLERNPNIIGVLPEHTYYEYAQDRVKPLFFEGKHHSDPGYSLSNVLSLDIKKNAKNREAIALFADYMKENYTARGWAYFNLWDVENFNRAYSNYKRLHTECWNFAGMITSNNPWKQIMGKFHYMLNCNSQHEFKDFSIVDYLSKILNIGKRQVTILYPNQKNREKGIIYVTLETAKQLSDIKNLKYGDTIVLPSNINDWAKTFTIDKLKTLESILRKNKLIKLPTTFLEFVRDDYDANTKDAALHLSSVLTSFFFLLDKELNEANTFVNKQNLPSLILEGISETIKSKIQDVLFSNEDFLQFLNENGKTKLFPRINKRIIETNQRIDEYNHQIIPKQQELKRINSRLSELLHYFNTNSLSFNKKQMYEVVVDEISKHTIMAKNFKETIDVNKMILKISSQTTQYGSNLENTSMNDLKTIIKKFEKKYHDELQKIQNLKLFLSELDSQTHVVHYMESQKEAATLRLEKSKLESKISELNELRERSLYNNDRFKQLMSIVNNLPTNSYLSDYFKNLELSQALELFSILFESSLNGILIKLDLVKNENGYYKASFKKLQDGDVSAIRKLFSRKEEINKLNKMIDFINSMKNIKNDNQKQSILKLLNIVIPKQFYNFLNTTITIANKKYTPKNGITIKPSEIYNKYVGITTGASALSGAAIGWIGNHFKSGQSKYGIIASLVGAIIGAIIGGVTSGVVTHSIFGDGHFQLNRIDPSILPIIENYTKNSKSRNSFNLFADGFNIVKHNYNNKLNSVFTELGKIYIKNATVVENALKDFQRKFPHSSLSGNKIVGEIFKNATLSPRLWEILGDYKNYERPDARAVKKLLTRENIELLYREITLDKHTWMKFTNNQNDYYLGSILQLQNVIARWILESSFPDNLYNIEDKKQKIVFGYNSNYINIKPLKDFALFYLKHHHANNVFEFVDLKYNPNKYVDAIFNFRLFTQKDRVFSNLHFVKRRMLSRQNIFFSIPIYKTDYVLFTTNFNKNFLNISKKDIKTS